MYSSMSVFQAVETCEDLWTHHVCTPYREDSSAATRYQRAQKGDEIDARFGFERYRGTTERMGWLINIHPVSSNPSHFSVAVTNHLTTPLE